MLMLGASLVLGCWCLELLWSLDVDAWSFSGAWMLELGALVRSVPLNPAKNRGPFFLARQRFRCQYRMNLMATLWLQTYDPLGNAVASTLMAALPVVILLGSIG